MHIRIDVDEATERFEESIELAVRDDEIVICREGQAVAELTSIPRTTGRSDHLRALAAEGRASVPAGTTSDHGDLDDEHGLPK